MLSITSLLLLNQTCIQPLCLWHFAIMSVWGSMSHKFVIFAHSLPKKTVFFVYGYRFFLWVLKVAGIHAMNTAACECYCFLGCDAMLFGRWDIMSENTITFNEWMNEWMHKGWATIILPLHWDIQWSNVLPLLVNPLSILHFEWNVGLHFGIVGGGVQLHPLGTAATRRPVVPAPGDYDGEIGGMIGRGNWSAQRKPAPVPLCPPQTPHAARTRTWAAAVGSQHLTAWATARPNVGLSFWGCHSSHLAPWRTGPGDRIFNNKLWPHNHVAHHNLYVNVRTS
jgi:hypothetical protein